MAAVKTELLISAAASLTDAFEQIGSAWSRSEKGAGNVRFNFAASGVLKQQIQAGAPVDVFASAALKEMDELQAAGLIERASRIDFARSRLVLILPSGSRLLIKSWKDLADPQVKRIALANPETVASGRYGKETLLHRRLWRACSLNSSSRKTSGRR
jgi:molybdate transport system substrate-binding protein